MASAARITDSIFGNDGGEHSGHILNPHPVGPLTGYISSCSFNVFINNLGAARIGDTTKEFDQCCGSSHGAVGQGSRTVYVNGIPFSRLGDRINPHHGAANITSGSPNVFVGG